MADQSTTGEAQGHRAATAMELAQPLATLNVRHFPMFPRVRAPY